MSATQVIMKYCPEANLEGVSEAERVQIASVYLRQLSQESLKQLGKLSFTSVAR